MSCERLRLTPRDQELLSVLCRRVRMLSCAQIARTWWNGQPKSEATAVERLDRLCAAGLLISRRTLVRNVGILTAPVLTWSPNGPLPDLGAAAWFLQKRWSAQPVVTTIYLATKRCSRLFGANRPGRVSRAFQVSHDLGVAEMFLALRRQRSSAVSFWVDEDRLAPYRHRQKLPDAVLARNAAAIPELVLEFGGGYSKARLVEFHQDNLHRQLPYELW